MFTLSLGPQNIEVYALGRDIQHRNILVVHITGQKDSGFSGTLVLQTNFTCHAVERSKILETLR